MLERDISELEDLLKTLSACMLRNTSAKAAADMALWDLYGQLCGLPVYKLLGGGRTRLETDLTISVNEPEEMARDALEAARRGYDTLKIKVGSRPELDLERLRQVRAAVGPGVRIRIDANQGWLPRQAVRLLNQMQDQGLELELVEQPVAAGDLQGLKYVTDRSPIPVLADESVFSPLDALQIMQQRAADMVNIKLMKCGGIYHALKIVSAAEVYGMECMIGCMLEAKVSVNAAVHLACAKSAITRIDLDGPVLCGEDPVDGGAVFSGKDIFVSDAPGLGIRGVRGVRYL
ncbi:L-Ala-D/L-Glu epimerase [bioreactor metagenome]|uniref:L-Ala-D/L-Glu epimerase n=1 Tax=bioreactor metagenome TaxID=1076179 RepID=A0A645DGN1_9ZZZZ